MLQALLCLPEQRVDNPYTLSSFTFDPRSLAQRVLDIRLELAREWAEDLRWVRDENADVLRATLACSLRLPPAVTQGTDDDGRPLAP